MNTHQREELERTATHASRWLEVLSEDSGPEVRAEFAAWIAESPVHVREFLNIAAIDQLLGRVDPLRRMPIETGRAPAARNVLGMRSDGVATKTTQARRARGNQMWARAAAVAVVAIGAGLFVWWQQGGAGWQEYATVTGEQSTLRLQDGSLVNLNTRSRLRVKFTGEARDVRLLEGEALFTVERDPARPFRVRAMDATIQALGTQFNVYRRSRDTTVSVLEGAVKVLSEDGGSVTGAGAPVLGAGEQVSISVGGDIARPAKVDVSKAVAWRERRLVFHADTVEDIAMEFNRYNATPRIRIQSEALRERRFTGVLDADKPESLMRFLTKEKDVVFERKDDELVVRTR